MKVETMEELNKRIEEFKIVLREYVVKYPRILIISHAVFMAHFTKTFTGIYNCQLITSTFE